MTPWVNGCSGLPVTWVMRPRSVSTTSEHADGQSCGQTESIVNRIYVNSAYDRSVPAALRKMFPFTTPESRRLAMLFAVVYFAQGMYDLPTQILTLTMKDRFGL